MAVGVPLRPQGRAPAHDFWPVPGWLNALLIRVYRVEAWLLARIDLPVGVSLATIARRPLQHHSRG